MNVELTSAHTHARMQAHIDNNDYQWECDDDQNIVTIVYHFHLLIGMYACHANCLDNQPIFVVALFIYEHTLLLYIV